MRFLFSLTFVALLALILFYAASRTKDAPVLDSLGTVEVVDEPNTRAQGLSGRAVVPDDYGMLFVFPRAELHGFWMKDMEIPIDMVWVNADGTIAGITESVTPETYPTAFYPPSPVPYVLEVRAGLAEERGWATGTPLSLPLP